MVVLNNLLLQVIIGRVLEMRTWGQSVRLCKVPRFSNRMLALVVADYSFLCDSNECSYIFMFARIKMGFKFDVLIGFGF